jgi:hypothetical protein
MDQQDNQQPQDDQAVVDQTVQNTEATDGAAGSTEAAPEAPVAEASTEAPAEEEAVEAPAADEAEVAPAVDAAPAEGDAAPAEESDEATAV